MRLTQESFEKVTHPDGVGYYTAYIKLVCFEIDQSLNFPISLVLASAVANVVHHSWEKGNSRRLKPLYNFDYRLFFVLFVLD